MKLKVELQAYLQEYSPDGQATFDYEMPEGSRVQDLVRKLGVPEEMAAVVIVSNSAVMSTHPLSEGDHVTLIPPLAGG